VVWTFRKHTEKVFNQLQSTGIPPKSSDLSHDGHKEFGVMGQNNMKEGD
jgi:hypothetical protein